MFRSCISKSFFVLFFVSFSFSTLHIRRMFNKSQVRYLDEAAADSRSMLLYAALQLLQQTTEVYYYTVCNCPVPSPPPPGPPPTYTSMPMILWSLESRPRTMIERQEFTTFVKLTLYIVWTRSDLYHGSDMAGGNISLHTNRCTSSSTNSTLHYRCNLK